YLQPKIIAASVAVVTCATGGTFAAVHVHAATTAAVTAPAPARPTAAPPASLAPVPGPQVTVQQKITPVASRPSRRRAATRPPTPAVTQPAVPGTKKGVATWSFGAAQQALAASGASWYYNWGSSPSISTPAGVSYVPQIWGSANVTSATLAQVRTEGHTLLGFNEPDLSSQSNLSVPQALSLWPQLEATGMTLGSPAVASGGDVAGGWLDQFMTGAAARGYRVDFITLHWYGSDFDSTAAVSQLQSYIQAVYNRYHKPIWLTEFGLANFGTGTFPTGAQQAAFVTGATAMLDQLPYVQRYAWFALPANSSDGTLGLFGSDGAATETGRAFEAAR
ncbi:MAG TPA: glycoside hydrolase family protein, partial [Streptosporangiaceae bacterium]